VKWAYSAVASTARGQRLARANPLQTWKQLLRSGGSLQEVATINRQNERTGYRFHRKALSFAGRLTRVECMKLYQQDLEKIADLTLEHYNRHAEEFWEGTRDHDVSQNIAALLRSIQSEPPFTILDFGCGPGRDLKAFAERGHIAVGLQGAPHTAAMARAHSGCAVCAARSILTVWNGSQAKRSWTS
jgi:hypothetical protein